MSRYVLYPGPVRSKNDGQLHFIGAGQLARLYCVRLADCRIYPSCDQQQRAWKSQPGEVALKPRFDGDYSIPSHS